MATLQQDFCYTAEAAADLSSDQYKFVKINSSGKAALVAAVGVDHNGVLQNKPTAGDAAAICASGITKVIAGGTIAIGDKLRITAAGVAIVADSDECVGIALSAAVSGNPLTCLLYASPTRVGPMFLGSVNSETLAAAKILVASDVTFQRLDPGGASRNLDLPAFSVSRGKAFFISNAADAAENLVVRAGVADGGATIVTLNQNEAAWVVCTGAAWVHMGVITIAQT